jgi:hypothetical protein
VVACRIRDLKAEAGGSDKSLTMFGPKCTAMYNLVQQAVKNKQFKGPVVGKFIP